MIRAPSSLRLASRSILVGRGQFSPLRDDAGGNQGVDSLGLRGLLELGTHPPTEFRPAFLNLRNFLLCGSGHGSFSFDFGAKSTSGWLEVTENAAHVSDGNLN